jgi:hypothetical protein
MTVQGFPIAALLLGHDADASRGARLAAMARTAAELGASPIVVAIPPGIELPPGPRVIRTRAHGSAIAAIRLGMAQLANSMARAALLWPHDGAQPSLVALLALVDEAKRSSDAIVAFAAAPLDRSPILVPRDAWLELVTLGEDGLGAVATRRRVARVEGDAG